ncbi:DUF3095 family protein [Azospirillum sp.]|uniref:DUF3095 family protein n=1 Tax=Azospirillum sp. TaxID=34012 RepID=UPI002D38F793|nr:DUF3095 family protein [Azospirillum sp.]HYD68692.1 DUF3095 family protein [Azospirillum sp.]
MQLPAIRDFATEGIDARRYAALGADWALAVADVVGSTRLAAEGRHREVNFIAGAVVAVLSSVLGTAQAPAACQFGGDGALAAVPPGKREDAARALAALAHWASVELDVPLRVGMVPVKALLDRGLEVRAAVHDFGGGNVFGQFLGAGVTAADAWVKADARWRIEPAEGPLPGLEGLSCRWQPVPAGRGTVLCVIADPVPAGAAGDAVLARLHAAIERVVPTEAAAPLGGGERLAPRWPPSLRALWLETRTESKRRRLGRVARALAGAAIIRVVHALGRPLGALDVARYRAALAERSDYRKEAGGPRLVLDVTEAEARAIEAVLARFAEAGEIRYGTARAAATTITCLVGDFAADRHVHFVDGADLGFWRASVMLKGMKG